MALVAIVGAAGLTNARLWTAAPEQTAEFALAGGADGLTVAEVTDPGQPVIAGRLTAAQGTVDVSLHPDGEVAYLAAGAAWITADVTDPKSPSLIAVRPETERQAVRVLATAGDRLFVVLRDPRAGTATIEIYDTTAPAEVKLLGDLSLTADVLGLDVAQDHLYVATGQILQIYAVQDPAEPRLVARLPRSAVDIAIDGTTAYLIEGGAMAVVDVRDPSNPVEVGFARLPFGTASVVKPLQSADCTSDCGRAIVGASVAPDGSGGGMVAVDASDRSQPVVLQATLTGTPIEDIASDAQILHVATGDSYLLFRVEVGLLPERVGALDLNTVALDLLLAPAQQTPTPTEDRSTPTTTPDRRTATPTATIQRETVTPETPTVTATATVGPSRTPTQASREPEWDSHVTGDGPVDFGRVRIVRTGPLDRTWIKIRRESGGPDQVMESDGQRVRLYDSVHTAVRLRYSLILEDGSVPDLWSVDADGNVWVGPEYYDGLKWHRLAQDETQPGGRLIHEERALLDANGLAWVPYRGEVGCPDPRGCATDGLRVFNEVGLERAVPVDVVPGAAEFGIDTVELIPGRVTTTAAALGHGRTAPAQLDDQDWIVAHRQLLILPAGSPVAYPELEAGSPTQNAGYATSATRTPDGHLQVFTWIEDHSGRPSLSWRILSNTWDGSSWDVWDITSESPLVHDGNEEFLRVTAASYTPDGTLWVGSSTGEIALWRDGVWLDHFTPGNSPLLDGRPVTDIFTDHGTTWIVQPGAMFTYGVPGALNPVISLFAPSAEQR